MTSQILLVGAGPMARSYVDVLKSLNVEFQVVGRCHDKANTLAAATGVHVTGGGILEWLENNPAPEKAIVATGVETLEEVTSALVSAGCKSILLEKPGAIDGEGVRRLNGLATNHDASIWIGFNRRYYASVARAREIVLEDGGISSAFFDFTELGYRIEALDKAAGIKENWFLANSLHVVDLAFHLIGAPREMDTRVSGRLPWHSRAAQYAGSGVSEFGVIFSYRADWAAPGRWKVELFTPSHRLLLSPMESLQVQKIRSFDQIEIELDALLDQGCKPGLCRQVEAWLSNDSELACTITDLSGMMHHYEHIAGYIQ